MIELVNSLIVKLIKTLSILLICGNCWLVSAEDVDILILYTEAVTDSYGGEDGVNAHVLSSMASANLGLENSEVSMQLNLVGVLETAYLESSVDMETDLENLTEGIGEFSDVGSLRDHYGADLVCLFRDGDVLYTAGIAWILNDVEGSPSKGYSVVSAESAISGRAFLHELGHNLGAVHDRENTEYEGLYSYSYGYRFEAEGVLSRTVMAYHPGAGINYISNPLLTFKGAAMGVAEGMENSADNAKTFNQSSPIVGGYRRHEKIVADAGGDLLLQDASNNGFETIILDGSGSRADGAIKSWEWSWDGGVASGEFASVELPLGDFLVTLTVVDGDGDISTDEMLVSIVPLGKVRMIEVSSSGTYILEENGSVWVSGSNDEGQLGLGNRSSAIGFTPLFPSGVAEVSAAGPHALFLMEDGSLWGTGSNEFGQLGDGTTETKRAPLRLVDSGVTSISAGVRHSLFVKSDGSLWGMGYNWSKQLGDGVENQSDVPIRIVEAGVKTAYAGFEGSLILNADGSLWRVGHVANGFSSHSPELFIETGVVDCSVHYGSYLIVKSDGSLWALGINSDGRIGGSDWYDLQELTMIVSSGVVSAVVGDSMSCFRKSDGSLWGVGKNVMGLWGDDLEKVYRTPLPLINSRVLDFEEGRGSVLILRDDHSIWGAGKNIEGQFGREPTWDFSELGMIRGVVEGTPNLGPVPSVEGAEFFDVDDTGRQQVSLDASGSTDDWQIVEWEWEWSGGQYVGKIYDAEFPVGETLVFLTVTDSEGVAVTDEIVVSVLPSTEIVGIADGGSFGYFLKRSGALMSAGNNSYGTLGIGGNARHVDPVVTINSGVASVAAGQNFGMVVTDGGALYGWGQNRNGNLGIGNSSNQIEVPVEVLDGGVISVSCGKEFSVFIKTDGSLWGMGSNEWRQLGSENHSSSGPSRVWDPVKIIGAGVASVSAGGQHVVFLKDDGSVWAMGANNVGQLGDGTYETRINPYQVNITNVVAVAAGTSHTLYLKSDGSLWGAGGNWSRELMPERTKYYATPIKLVDSGVTGIMAGAEQSYYFLEDGSLWGMGNNDYGQLGSPAGSISRELINRHADKVVGSILSTLVLMKDGSLRLFGFNYFVDPFVTKKDGFVEVIPSAKNVESLEQWLLNYYSSAEIEGITDDLYLLDFDNDGLSNETEWLVGLDPSDSESRLTFDFRVEDGRAVIEVRPYSTRFSYKLRSSNDLRRWLNARVLSSESEFGVLRVTAEMESRKFFRMEVNPQ